MPSTRRAANSSAGMHYRKTSAATRTSKRPLNVGKWADLDELLYQWYHNHTGSISDADIRAQAIALFTENYPGSEVPEFSQTWVRRWRRRYSSYFAAALNHAIVHQGAGFVQAPRLLGPVPGAESEPSNKTRLSTRVIGAHPGSGGQASANANANQTHKALQHMDHRGLLTLQTSLPEASNMVGNNESDGVGHAQGLGVESGGRGCGGIGGREAQGQGSEGQRQPSTPQFELFGSFFPYAGGGRPLDPKAEYQRS